jgi:protein TonB
VRHLGTWATIATVAVHGGLAWSLHAITIDPPQAPTVITLREAPPKRAPEPPKPPPPAVAAAAIAPPAAPPRPARPRPAAKAAPAPIAAAPASAAPPSFNVAMGNGGGNGAALPAPHAEAAPAVKPPVVKQLAARPALVDGGCADPIVKPRPLQLVQPAFTQDARDAGITGKVRVEVTINAAGAVTAARVIAGLGHGLDEAALDAARASTFTPATQCGAPVAITITIGMRFQT